MVSPTLQPVDSFDAATHTYYRNLMVVPGLSQILKETGICSYDGIPPGILERKARLGSAVHSACEMYDRGEEFDELHPEVAPYFDCYTQAKSKIGWEWREIEQFKILDVGEHGTGCRELYGCTPDRIGQYNGNPFRGVLELKCTLRQEPHHALQTAMQTACVSGGLYVHVPRAVIYLDKSGKFNVDKHFVEHKEHSRDLLAARQIISTWYWKQFYGRKK
jgi:hypothetical protein